MRVVNSDGNRSHRRGRLWIFEMGELISLKRAQKRRAKDAAEKDAELNRVRFGRTKAERALDAARSAKTLNELDQHKLTPGKSK